jgi:transcriptional regulator with GAF, ATPase, and Fis domain
VLVDLQDDELDGAAGPEIEPVGAGRARKVDVRVIAATNRDLAAAVSEGTFRDDLYSRLNVVPIRLAPLRERRADIPLLARHFLETESRTLFGRPAPRISDPALELLGGVDYPGNVRDLRNLVIRVLIRLTEPPTARGDAHRARGPMLSASRQRRQPRSSVGCDRPCPDLGTGLSESLHAYAGEIPSGGARSRTADLGIMRIRDANLRSLYGRLGSGVPNCVQGTP